MTVNPTEIAGNTIQSARWNVILAKLQGARSGGSADRDVIMTGIYSRDPIQSANLTHYWKFDEEDAATAYDYTAGNEQDLTGESITSFVDGVLKSAVDLDGTADYFHTETLTDWADDTAGSFSVWIKPEDTTNSGAIWVFGDTAGTQTMFLLQMNSSGGLQLLYKESGADIINLLTAADTITQGVWNHIVVTQDGVAPVIYINGTRIPTTGTSSTEWIKDAIDEGADNFYVGALNYNGGGVSLFFEGIIDELMCWNLALTPGEVKQLYASYNPGLEVMKNNLMSGLTGYWNFDEYTAVGLTTAYDYSGSAISLTHVSAPPVIQGKYGIAPNYDGAADYTYGATTSWANDTQGTISIWIKVDGNPGSTENFIFFGDDNTVNLTRFAFYLDNVNDKIAVVFKDDSTNEWLITSSADAGFASYIGVWKHICVTHNGIEPTLYIDAVEDTTFAISTDKTAWLKTIITDATNKSDVFALGALRENGGAGEYFDGGLDEFRVYNRPLSAEEVMLLFRGFGR